MSCLQILKSTILTLHLQSFLETQAYTASSSWTDKVCQKTPAKKHLQLHYKPDTNKICPKIKRCVCQGPGHTQRSQLPWPATQQSPHSQSLAYYRTSLCTSAKFCTRWFHKSSCFITGQVRKIKLRRLLFWSGKYFFICNNKQEFNFWIILQHPVKAMCSIPSST